MHKITPVHKKELAKDSGACVYFLYLGDDIVYVGQTTNLFMRLNSHIYDKAFDNFSYITTKKDELNDSEALAIVKHNPFYNRILPKNKYYIIRSKLNTIVTKSIKGVIDDNSVFDYNHMDKSKDDMSYVTNEFAEQLIEHIMKFKYISVGEE